MARELDARRSLLWLVDHTPKTKMYRLQDLFSCSCFLICLIYIPDDDVRFILCAPNFEAAGLAPRILLAAKGLTVVVGGGAAMAAHGSSSAVTAVFTVIGFEVLLGTGAAMDPHKSSSPSLGTFAVLFGLKLVTENQKENTWVCWIPLAAK